MMKKLWHPFFSETLKQLFEPKGFSVETEIEVGKLPLRIDILVIKKTKDADVKSLPVVFQSFTDYNIIEYKSPNDRFRQDDFDRLFAYSLLFKIKEKIQWRRQINVYALICGGIKGIKAYICRNGHELVKIKEGLYYSDFGFNFYLIQLDQLEVIPENYKLILFSGKELIKELISKLSGEEESRYLIELVETGLCLYPEEFKEVEIMHKTLADRPDIMAELVDRVGIDKFIYSVGEDRVIRSVGEDRVIRSIGEDRVIRSIGEDKVIHSIGEDNIIRNIGEDRVLENLINMMGKEKIQKMLEGL